MENKVRQLSKNLKFDKYFEHLNSWHIRKTTVQMYITEFSCSAQNVFHKEHQEILLHVHTYMTDIIK